jgi:nucleoside-diphosphate-sugar epimerase
VTFYGSNFFPDRKNINYLTDLPGASERLQFFNADLDKPDSFDAAIEGCIGVFHVSHPMDFEGKETEEELTRRAVNGTLGVLQACVNAKTVKRVVYTSTIGTVMLDNKGQDIVDETTWSEIDHIRSSNRYGAVYAITKTLTEKACLEFAEKHGLDLVTVLPSGIHGPFLTPNMPGSVRVAMAMIFGMWCFFC